MPCRQALLFVYTAWACVELELVECLVFTGLVWMVITHHCHGAHRIYSWRRNYSAVAWERSLSYGGGVMIWNPWLASSVVCVGCVWGPYLFLCVYIINFVGLFTLLSSCNCT